MPERIPTRHSILSDLAQLVANDFGDPPVHSYQPFCPHCVAHQAVRMLQSAYEEVDVDNPTMNIEQQGRVN